MNSSSVPNPPFHDPRTAAGADDETAAALLQALRPLREAEGEGAGVFVVARHLDRLLGPLQIVAGGSRLLQQALAVFRRLEARGAEHHDRVLDVQLFETRLGLQVLGQNPQAARIRAVEELFVLVGLHGPVAT